MGKPNLSARFRLIRQGLLNFEHAKPTTLVKRDGKWCIELNQTHGVWGPEVKI